MNRFSVSMVLLLLVILAIGCSPSPNIPAQPTITPNLNPEFLQATLFPGSITLEILKNLEYPVQNGMQLALLVDGKYESGSGSDYFSVNMLNMAAFGDLDADGNEDAAVILVENNGGTGQFEYLVPVFYIAGTQAAGGASANNGFFLGDGVTVNSMRTENGVITLNMLVHSPNDGLCCPGQPMTQSYRFYWGIGLVMVHATSETADDAVREITIDTPAAGTQVSAQIHVKGNVTVAPLENNLLIRVLDVNNTPLYQRPIPVSASDTSAAGSFDIIVDLSSPVVYPGPIRIEISEVRIVDGIEVMEVNMIDGSALALDSVDVILFP